MKKEGGRWAEGKRADVCMGSAREREVYRYGCRQIALGGRGTALARARENRERERAEKWIGDCAVVGGMELELIFLQVKIASVMDKRHHFWNGFGRFHVKLAYLERFTNDFDGI